MSWVKVDDGWYSHPKALSVSLAARGLWLAGLCWSGHHLTDGAIPRRVLALLAADDVDADGLASELVDAGLWEATDGGWQVHDYTDRQLSREQVEAARADGSKGNHERWHVRRGVVDNSCPHCAPDRVEDRGGDREPDPKPDESGGDRGGESQTRPDQTRPDTPPTPPADPSDDLALIWRQMADWELDQADEPPRHTGRWLTTVQARLAAQHARRATQLLAEGVEWHHVAEMLAHRRPAPRRGLGCDSCTDGYHPHGSSVTPCRNCNPAAPRLEAVR